MVSPVNTITGLRPCSMCKREFDEGGFHSQTTTYCRECNLKYLKARRFAARDAAETTTLADGKVCMQCGELKPAREFSRSNREQDRHAARCNECRDSLRVARNKRKGPTKRTYQLKSKYGIYEEDYASMLAQQGYACAICRQPHSLAKPLHVDHNHVTGQVRGLLCGHCNTAIGYLKDSPMFCRAAALYLEGSVP